MTNINSNDNHNEKTIFRFPFEIIVFFIFVLSLISFGFYILNQHFENKEITENTKICNQYLEDKDFHYDIAFSFDKFEYSEDFLDLAKENKIKAKYHENYCIFYNTKDINQHGTIPISFVKNNIIRKLNEENRDQEIKDVLRAINKK